MHLLNYLSLRTAQQLFVAAGRYRTEQVLVGSKTGTNCVFRVPNGDRFVHILPMFTIQIYLNGLRQAYIDDYTVLESGGLGAGYDTIVFIEAPMSDDSLLADYVATRSL